MVIGRSYVDDIVAHARQAFPNESCGILASHDGAIVHFYPIDNADESPVHFTLEPQQQLHALTDLDDRDWDLGAVYHSHTRTRAYPSATDQRFAQTTSALYPSVLYAIVSLADETAPELRWFEISGADVREVDVQIVDD